MKLSAIVSTVLCLGASQFVGAEALTSTLTTTITRTLVRVNAVTPSATATPSPSSSVPLIPTSHPASSSTLFPSTATATATVSNAPEDPLHTNMATGFEGNMPIALAGGAFALLFGAL
ncbi:hypothetical protein BDW59DRAFT_163911 [Aspergillus cavernicola]|uniref:Uncharacterized protein n=1 Tax=Aspergillus cavernicola TaxID=176166 RepID=A0ABR4I320_9EURO